MARSAIECFVRAIQGPRVHERGGHPGIVTVTSAAGVRKAFMRRVEGVLDIVYVADDAVGASNLDAGVVLRTTGARSVEQQCTQRSDGREPYPHSARKKHRVPYKIAGFSKLTWQG